MQGEIESNYYLNLKTKRNFKRERKKKNMNQEENLENQSISRLQTKKQSLDDMYSVPANFLEIDVINPQTTIVAGKKKFTDYEIRMRVSET